MAVVQVSGPRPERLAAAMRAGGRQIPGRLRRGFQRALAPLDMAVKTQAAARFPAGYAPTFNADVKVALSMRGRGATVTVDARVFAPGRQDRRDVPALNAGVLRHPVFGRSRRRVWTADRPRRRLPGGQVLANPWVAQAIPAGFADAAVEQVRPQVDTAMDAVLRDVEATITGA